MRKLLIALAIGILLFPVIACIGLYLSEWVHHEITLQRWLDEDSRRIDLFKLGSISSRQERLREILLEHLPPGSSEEEVKAFYLANQEKGPVRWNPEKYSNENREVLTFWALNRSHGHYFKRMVGGRVVVILHLEPVDNSLMDITVKLYGFDL